MIAPTGHTVTHAGSSPFSIAVRAEVALLDRAQILVQIERVVRAGLHAGAAADAGVPIDVDDAVRALFQRVDRADRHARRVGAVVAALNQEVALDLGKLADLDVLDVGSEAADRHVVLGFAGDRAGVAPDAGVLVDHEPVLHLGILPIIADLLAHSELTLI